jgi:hypothetical protein
MPTSYREIPLSGKRGAGKVALVDEEDYAILSQFRWWYQLYPKAGRQGYAYRTVWAAGKRAYIYIYMHNAIMCPPPDVEVDHIRVGNGLDNRRCNLRLVPHWVNLHNTGPQRNNTSGFKGVSWAKRRGAWQAHIKIQGKQRFLGHFATADDAHAACEAARAALGVMPDATHDARPDAALPPRPLGARNKSGYRGVFWNKQANLWQATIQIGGKNHYLGRYATPQEASVAYEAARARLPK